MLIYSNLQTKNESSIDRIYEFETNDTRLEYIEVEETSV